MLFKIISIVKYIRTCEFSKHIFCVQDICGIQNRFLLFIFKLISVSCPTSLSPKAGSAVVETDGLASVTYFTCNSGYTIFGKSNITCQTSGVWNYEAPHCGNDFYNSIIMSI